jgi:hypothetical protein
LVAHALGTRMCGGGMRAFQTGKIQSSVFGAHPCIFARIALLSWVALGGARVGDEDVRGGGGGMCAFQTGKIQEGLARIGREK